MKVNSQLPLKKPIEKAPEKLSQDEIAAKVAARFGKTSIPKEKPVEVVADTVELRTNPKAEEGAESADATGSFKNDPASEETRSKLKGILEAGAFQFNDKERQALGKILS